jgi:rhodanese-related sulfurtransferase
MTRTLTRALLPLLLCISGQGRAGGDPPTILDAVAGASAEPGGQRAPEISTRELQRALDAGSVLVFDARSPKEFATGHLPGALNVAGKPGLPPSQYTSDIREVERAVQGNKARPIILYCNGVYCGRSRRLADDLIAAGFTSVRRYQLGMPVWRALGGVQEIELEGLLDVLRNDRTAVLLDARGAGGLPGARGLPVAEVRDAKDDGRLPMDDHHTRILVVGASAQDARALAEGVARDAFDNVAYYAGSAAKVQDALVSSTGSH